MWTKSPQVLDEPAKILGLELDDFSMATVVPLFLALFFDALPSFAGGFLLGLTLYFAKRGKAPGAMLHTLHRLELIHLPGILGPKRQRYSPW
jgi:hypothetical protein